MVKTILVVDDEVDIRNLVCEILADEGYKTLTAANSKEVYEVLNNHTPDMVVLDIWLRDSRHDGLQILESIKEQHADIPVIMISGHGTVETAVSAIKQGAYDFIEKPFKSDRLLLMVRRGIEAANLQQENQALRMQSRTKNVEIVGQSAQSKALREKVNALSSHSGRLLITGPLGAGKTTIARLVHGQSGRAHEPLLVHFCVNGTDDVTLSETLAKARNGSVIFQDVCALSQDAQKELLSLLQKNVFPARIIATARDPDALDGGLFQRLSVESMVVPSLIDRKGDISAFIDVFLTQATRELGLKKPIIGDDFLKQVEQYQWPGNLYELRAVVFLALLNGRDKCSLGADDLPPRVSAVVREGAVDNVALLSQESRPNHAVDGVSLELSLREAREVFEREYLTSQVERFDGNISKTAQFIGMERSALHRKIKSLQNQSDGASHAPSKQQKV